MFRLRPWKSLNEIYYHCLESKGTKAYTYEEATKLFEGFEIVRIESPLTHGDLLTSDVGARHKGGLLAIAKKMIPRSLIMKILPNHGLSLMVTMYRKSI